MEAEEQDENILRRLEEIFEKICDTFFNCFRQVLLEHHKLVLVGHTPAASLALIAAAKVTSNVTTLRSLLWRDYISLERHYRRLLTVTNDSLLFFQKISTYTHDPMMFELIRQEKWMDFCKDLTANLQAENFSQNIEAFSTSMASDFLSNKFSKFNRLLSIGEVRELVYDVTEKAENWPRDTVLYLDDFASLILQDLDCSISDLLQKPLDGNENDQDIPFTNIDVGGNVEEILPKITPDSGLDNTVIPEEVEDDNIEEETVKALHGDDLDSMHINFDNLGLEGKVFKDLTFLLNFLYL